jgi:inosine/xanthosine triphosphatase
METIAVGSGNPVKIRAVSRVIARVWPEAEVVGVQVSSGVRAMPMNEAECIAGATERARAARELLDADLGLGLEGGVQAADGRLYLSGWVAAVDRRGRESLASGARIPLPPQVAAAVQAGEELGPVMDRLTGREKTKHAEGAVGILTRGLVTRQGSFEAGVAYALVPWLNPEWYS